AEGGHGFETEIRVLPRVGADLDEPLDRLRGAHLRDGTDRLDGEFQARSRLRIQDREQRGRGRRVTDLAETARREGTRVASRGGQQLPERRSRALVADPLQRE